ncbi:mitochondrial import inner membrane translocase subunit Tim8-like [Panonychus citri]|uniref:mitochondrial import inner membrane translocase subunit Tim8-like n=1 Tax=Panonychus citri TaxID=50023 RepID=UPI0023070B16|nr:mitochondrial import inner membrane translocase subunit Tim8-like [Panonychus citri]
MSLDFSDGSGDFDAGGVMLDKDLQNFILQEQQVAQFNAQVHKLTEHCWDKCVNDKLTSRFDGKTETCITNCVERFIDASVVIAQRFSSKIMSSAK